MVVRRLPLFVRPEQLKRHKKNPSGYCVYVKCPDCGEAAFLRVDTRSGQCYGCERIIKLHRTYQDKECYSNDDIADALGVSLSAYKGTSPDIIQPYPLSQDAIRYLHSRSINDETLSRFNGIQETQLYGRKYLCWVNITGSFELRSVGGSHKRTAAGGTKAYSVFHNSEGSNYCIGESIISTMSYAQLTGYEANTYVVLNSTSMIKMLISNMAAWQVSKCTLALDSDKAGLQGEQRLYDALSPLFNVIIDHPPIAGCDWSDILTRSDVSLT